MTSFGIKILALIAMTCDHIAMIFSQSGLMAIFPSLSTSVSCNLVHFLEHFARIAFPLFAFVMAQGMQKTRSMPKYIGRLFLFAVISEPIYYFATRIRFTPKPTLSGFLENLGRLNFENVLFTLALAAVAVYVYQLLEKKNLKGKWLIFLPVLLLIVYIAGYVHTNYGMYGILLVVVLYFCKAKWQICLAVGGWVVLLYILIKSGFGYNWGSVSSYDVLNALFAMLAMIPIGLYSGQRGKRMKWGFYIYYPTHLLALAALRLLLVG